MRKIGFFGKPSAEFSAAQQEREIRRQMNDLRQAMEQAQLRFDLACEEELVDSCIYEMNALAARYRFLLRQAKELQAQPQTAASA